MFQRRSRIAVMTDHSKKANEEPFFLQARGQRLALPERQIHGKGESLTDLVALQIDTSLILLSVFVFVSLEVILFFRILVWLRR